MYDICLGNEIVSNPSQPQKTVSSILVIPLGITTVVKLSILKNILSGILVIPDDNFTYFKL